MTVQSTEIPPEDTIASLYVWTKTHVTALSCDFESSSDGQKNFSYKTIIIEQSCVLKDQELHLQQYWVQASYYGPFCVVGEFEVWVK